MIPSPSTYGSGAKASSTFPGIPPNRAYLDNTNRRNRYVATPDGQRFLFVTTTKSLDTAPFIVVQNWQTALKH
jgi:hypothetical protein